MKRTRQTGPKEPQAVDRHVAKRLRAVSRQCRWPDRAGDAGCGARLSNQGGPKARGQSPHAGFGAEAAEWGGALGARPRSGCAHLSAVFASAGKNHYGGRATTGTIWKSDISPIADC